MTDLLERVRQQVAGMFARNDFEVEMTDDREAYRVIGGTSETIITFAEWHDDVIVILNAVVLADVPARGRQRTLMLEKLNHLNRQLPLGKLYTRDKDPEEDNPSTLELEYQLLGKNLDLTEFMPALEHVVYLADDLADRLKPEVGGKLWFEFDSEEGDAVDS
jgi:hypothetical protein